MRSYCILCLQKNVKKFATFPVLICNVVFQNIILLKKKCRSIEKLGKKGKTEKTECAIKQKKKCRKKDIRTWPRHCIIIVFHNSLGQEDMKNKLFILFFLVQALC
jgi:hypothetical protein